MVERRCVRLGLLLKEGAVRDAQLLCVSVVACKSHLATFDNADRLPLNASAEGKRLNGLSVELLPHRDHMR